MSLLILYFLCVQFERRCKHPFPKALCTRCNATNLVLSAMTVKLDTEIIMNLCSARSYVNLSPKQGTGPAVGLHEPETGAITSISQRKEFRFSSKFVWQLYQGAVEGGVAASISYMQCSQLLVGDLQKRKHSIWFSKFPGLSN